MDRINDRIKQIREQSNLSQAAFGKIIGLSKSGVSNIENGVRSIRDNYIKLICSHFNVDENWLRYGDDTDYKEYQLFHSLREYLDELNMDIEQDEDDKIYARWQICSSDSGTIGTIPEDLLLSVFENILKDAELHKDVYITKRLKLELDSFLD